jgi:hypothetical protein
LKRVIVMGVLGALLLWLGAGLSCALVEGFAHAVSLGRHMPWFLGGFGLYFLLHLFFYRPLLSHILAHELTHALAALLMGGRVTAVHATTSGGSTLINKSHWFISLAPYVFPFYSAIVLGVWALSAASFKPALSAVVGFLYAYHWTLTVYTLAHPQPDLKEAGVWFSLIFIFTGNMMVLMALVLALWPEALTPASAFERTMFWSFHLVISAWSLLKSLIPAREARPS